MSQPWNLGPSKVDFYGMLTGIGRTLKTSYDSAAKDAMRREIGEAAAKPDADFRNLSGQAIAAGMDDLAGSFLKAAEQRETGAADAAAAKALGGMFGSDGSGSAMDRLTGAAKPLGANGAGRPATQPLPSQAMASASAAPIGDISRDEDLAIRTTIGEAIGEGPTGWKAVAGVIGNRAKGSGMSLSDVVLAPNQFEPWQSRRAELESYDPNSSRYREVAAAILPVLRNQESDPTGGATHFYAPKAQRALGRRAPSWDDGSGVDVGNHRFFRLGYAGSGAGRHGIPPAGGPRGVVASAEGSSPGQDAPAGAPTADEVPQLIQAGILPEQITPGYLSEIWNTQPQLRQAVEQWRSQRGGSPTRVALGSDPAAIDAARAAQDGGPRRVLSAQYPAVPQGGGNPRMARLLGQPLPAAAPAAPMVSTRDGAGGMILAETPDEVAAAERSTGMVNPDGSAPLAKDAPKFGNDAIEGAELPARPAKLGDPSTWQRAEDVPAAAARGIQKRQVGDLMAMMGNSRLSPGMREVAKFALAHQLNESKQPENVKTFLWARANGETTAKTFQEWQALGKEKSDPGDKVKAEASARRDVAAQLGIPEGTDEHKSYVTTGKLPTMVRPDAKAISAADADISAAQDALSSIREAIRLSPLAYDGVKAGLRGQIAANIGIKGGNETLELNNVVTSGALAQLKSIFGGNPTEGERKIQIEVSGSADQPRKVREAIYARAQAAIERRLKIATEKAAALREGTYYKPGGGPGGRQAAPAQASEERAGPRPAPAARFDELTSQGLSKQDAYRTMAQEGY